MKIRLGCKRAVIELAHFGTFKVPELEKTNEKPDISLSQKGEWELEIGKRKFRVIMSKILPYDGRATELIVYERTNEGLKRILVTHLVPTGLVPYDGRRCSNEYSR